MGQTIVGLSKRNQLTQPNFMLMQSPFWNGYSLFRLFCDVSRVSGMISNLSGYVSERFECNLRKLILVPKVKFRDLGSNSVSGGGGRNIVRTASVSVQIVRKWSSGIPWVGFEL